MRAYLMRYLALAWLAGVVAAGCRSPGKTEGSASRFASVDLKGNTPGQIREVVLDVFYKHGYLPTAPGLTQLTFEKTASGMSNFAYGNWMGDTRVTERLKVSIVPGAEEGAFRLECQAYMVRDSGRALEEEVKLTKVHAHRYQKMLDEIAGHFRAAGQAVKK